MNKKSREIFEKFLRKKKIFHLKYAESGKIIEIEWMVVNYDIE